MDMKGCLSEYSEDYCFSIQMKEFIYAPCAVDFRSAACFRKWANLRVITAALEIPLLEDPVFLQGTTEKHTILIVAALEMRRVSGGIGKG